MPEHATVVIKRLTVLSFCLLTGTQMISRAQIRPGYPVIFDDFDYASETELLGINRWTNLYGSTVRNDRAWYKGGWDESEFAGTARLSVDVPGQIRLETEAGHYYAWYPGYLPPIMTSGFTHRSGTWVARIRFDNISRGDKTDTPQTHAFWTFSQQIACAIASITDNCPRRLKRWSEFNHEWNNYFRESPSQFLANGVMIDGEDPHISSLMMRNPERPSSPDLSCQLLEGGESTSIDDPDQCMDWFVSDSDPYRYVDLLIQYDNEMLVFEAVAKDLHAGKRTDRAIVMRESVHIGRSTQPMATKFSIVGKTMETCQRQQNAALSCWKQDETLGFSVDWFLYTPETSIGLWDIIENVEWFQDQGLTRVNTTRQSLASPPKKSRLTVSLENPLTNSDQQWVAMPSQQSTRYGRLKIEWQVRTRRRPEEAWTAWSAPKIGGFNYSPPFSSIEYDMVNVRATVSDFDDPANRTSVTGCLVGFGTTPGSCAASPRSYVLGDNYPNPFNPSTTITIELPQPGPVLLVVYDILGREIATLVNGHRDAGVYPVTWNTGSAASGLYFYELRTPDFRHIKQMILYR